VEKKLLHFCLNGEEMEVQVDPSASLMDVIRDDLEMTGTKAGCNTGDCGACTVILDGEAVRSCIMPALHVMDRNVETIEGIGSPDNLHPVQEEFVESSAFQCGYCTPGMIMSAKALLDKNPEPTGEDVREAIAGNLCRCTGYKKIEEAFLSAAKKVNSKSS